MFSVKNKKVKVKKILLLEEIENAEKQENRRKIRRTMWDNPFLLTRWKTEAENKILTSLLWGDDNLQFKNFTRLKYEDFEEIHSMCKTIIEREDTHMRDAVSSRVRLAVTLRHIATGDSYKSLEVQTGISKSTISLFVPQVLHAIYQKLQLEYMKLCSAEEDWMQIVQDFDKIWNFPHVCGALGGKHYRIKGRAKQGSNFYNYKGCQSIILLALVDANCRFIYIDVGANGRGSDSKIYAESCLHESLKKGKLHIPHDAIISGEAPSVPYYFIGDDAFPLDNTMMKPYSRCLSLTTKQKIFNYRLSRARITVECAFGHLASRFRIFYRPMDVKLDTMGTIIKAACVLHNFITTKNQNITCIASSAEDLVPNELPETFGAISEQVLSAMYYRSHEIRDTITVLGKALSNFNGIKFKFNIIHIYELEKLKTK